MGEDLDRQISSYPPNGTAMLKKANIFVRMSFLYISAMIVGATHEYEASPTPTKLRRRTKSQNNYDGRERKN